MNAPQGQNAELSRKQEQAIVALLTQPNAAEAARVANVLPRTLARWMKDPLFEAHWSMARSAGFDQAIARLQKISGAAAGALLKVMRDPDAPASARLRAAETVCKHARAGRELEVLQARLSGLESEREMKTDDKDGKARTARPAKLLPKQEEAVLALLTQRSVEEAARATKVATQTLYRWMRNPDFEAAWRAAGREAFRQATARLQQATSAAATTVIRITADPLTPPSVRVRAADLALGLGRLAAEGDIRVRFLRLGFAREVAEAALNGDRRAFEVIERDLLGPAA